MLNTDQTAHNTTALQITGAEGEGWEFQCEDCDFRMRYFVSDYSQEPCLEVFNMGDEEAQHLGDITSLEKCNHLLWKEWLTPEIRETIDRIFKKYEER